MTINQAVLKQVLANVLGIPAETIDDGASVDTIESWDSLKHLNLVLAIEEEFKVTLSEEQTVEILNYPLIKLVLAEHGINFI